MMSTAIAVMALFVTLQDTTPPNQVVTMNASYYGGSDGFHGRQMASGERFNAQDPTVAAHKTLPFGTKIKLTNPQTGQAQLVEVKDRGPFEPGRQLDVSAAAAKNLGFKEQGVAKLEAEIIGAKP